MAPFVMASIAMCLEKDTLTFLQPIYRMNYLHSSMKANLYVTFGNNRTPFNCYEELYCPYKYPKFILKTLGIEDSPSLVNESLILSGIFVVATSVFMLLQLKMRLDYRKKV